MKDLIKKQEEEFKQKFFVKDGQISVENIVELKDFISKVRKETAEYVCDEIEKNRNEIKQFDPGRDFYNRGREAGYNYTLDDIKRIKQDILKDFK